MSEVTSVERTMPHLSIGEVLGLLLEEFPDVTISKIRFLESQGLIDPERTPSGYRKFYDDDVELLRCILREQRENYLPLRVIKDRIDSGEIDPTGEQLRPRGIRNVGDGEPFVSRACPATATDVESVTGAAALFVRTDGPPPASRGQRPPAARPPTSRAAERREPAVAAAGCTARTDGPPATAPARTLRTGRRAPALLPERPLARRTRTAHLLRRADCGVVRRAGTVQRGRARHRSRSRSRSSMPASTLVTFVGGGSPPIGRPDCSTSSSSRSCGSATPRPVPTPWSSSANSRRSVAVSDRR